MVAKNNAYESLYQRLESREGEEVIKLARPRERRIRDLGSIRCIKDEDGKIPIEDTKIHGRAIFYKLFNEKRVGISQCNVQRGQEEPLSIGTCHHITKEEIRKPLKQMKAGKAVSSYSIPVSQ